MYVYRGSSGTKITKTARWPAGTEASWTGWGFGWPWMRHPLVMARLFTCGGMCVCVCVCVFVFCVYVCTIYIYAHTCLCTHTCVLCTHTCVFVCVVCVVLWYVRVARVCVRTWVRVGMHMGCLKDEQRIHVGYAYMVSNALHMGYLMCWRRCNAFRYMYSNTRSAFTWMYIHVVLWRSRTLVAREQVLAEP